MNQPVPASADAREQLRALYDAHLRDVWYALRRLGVPSRDLEDACHEVFLVAHRRLDVFDHDRPARPWLCGIAWRVAAAWRRRAGARLVSVGIERDVLAEGPDASRQLEARDAADLVQRALEVLPEAQRDVFVLHELDGLSMPEIAELTSVPLNTLYSRLRLGRARFAAEAIRLRDGGGA
ncbi:MAG: hypothetical protein RIT45_3241 [Pseudomonadota bacterium]|jgi:RNA polymerase sigma-70 factor (ECF subfamily)